LYCGLFEYQVLVVEEGVNNAFRTILRWADKYKKLGVFADISSPEDCYKNLDFGSDGVGMLRMENLLMLGKKREAVLDYLIGE
jgi:pyruvate,orthophosphate dikinase